jgi:hypothetical protein
VVIIVSIIAGAVVLVGATTLFLVWRGHTVSASEVAYCLNNQRQIGLAMFQYANDHDDNFMPLVDADGNKVKVSDNYEVLSRLPARSGFAVLLKEHYLVATKVFIDPFSGDHLPTRLPKSFVDFSKFPLKELLLKEDECSFGWDPTKTRSVDTTCAILADKPSVDVSLANEGTAKNNSDNHRKLGQGVFYNDGHVKWQRTPVPDAGDDPDIYTGGPGYQQSPTDAKIIR